MIFLSWLFALLAGLGAVQVLLAARAAARLAGRDPVHGPGEVAQQQLADGTEAREGGRRRGGCSSGGGGGGGEGGGNSSSSGCCRDSGVVAGANAGARADAGEGKGEASPGPHA